MFQNKNIIIWYGAVAHMVERTLCMREAARSMLASSNVSMSEWLRSQTWNLMGSARASSNLVAVVFLWLPYDSIYYKNKKCTLWDSNPRLQRRLRPERSALDHSAKSAK